MKTIITMLRDYCNKYDAVKLQYFFNLYISIISFELNYCNLQRSYIRLAYIVLNTNS